MKMAIYNVCQLIDSLNVDKYAYITHNLRYKIYFFIITPQNGIIDMSIYIINNDVHNTIIDIMSKLIINNIQNIHLMYFNDKTLHKSETYKNIITLMFHYLIKYHNCTLKIKYLNN